MLQQPDYSSYYWKNSKILMRLASVNDWERHYLNYFDSESRFLVDDEIELPPSVAADKEKWEAFVNPQATHGRIVFAIENPEGETVGICNMNSIDERHGCFSVGMQMHRDFRGKGYGAAALRMLGRYAFLERRLHRWNSAYVEENAASAALHRRLGFAIEGVERECLYHGGRYWNTVHCGLLAGEFLLLPANLED